MNTFTDTTKEYLIKSIIKEGTLTLYDLIIHFNMQEKIDMGGHKGPIAPTGVSSSKSFSFPGVIGTESYYFIKSPVEYEELGIEEYNSSPKEYLLIKLLDLSPLFLDKKMMNKLLHADAFGSMVGSYSNLDSFAEYAHYALDSSSAVNCSDPNYYSDEKFGKKIEEKGGLKLLTKDELISKQYAVKKLENDAGIPYTTYNITPVKLEDCSNFEKAIIAQMK